MGKSASSGCFQDFFSLSWCGFLWVITFGIPSAAWIYRFVSLAKFVSHYFKFQPLFIWILSLLLGLQWRKYWISSYGPTGCRCSSFKSIFRFSSWISVVLPSIYWSFHFSPSLCRWAWSLRFLFWLLYFSFIKFQFGSSLCLPFPSRDFLSFLFFDDVFYISSVFKNLKHVHNTQGLNLGLLHVGRFFTIWVIREALVIAYWSLIIMMALESSSDNANISITSMLRSLYCHFLFEIFLVIQMTSSIRLKAVIFILCSEASDLI